ncbi:MAG: UDP-N-acetylmuramate--L-alanine ligase [Bacteroidales bacterium]|nr:UDP-N-acetylmuramate--L-alanine ligase [Bacteroidales bacterium]
MMLEYIHKVYFIGIGGIGMSALARYFKAKQCDVCGYDRVETSLTRKLCEEGIPVHYSDDIASIPESYKSQKEQVLVIYTPAVPTTHREMNWFRENGYTMMKRSGVLGMISRAKETIAVAGTHGKTSVSTMIAHLLTQAGIGCDAFLGGISKNYQTNLLLSATSEYLVAEADEYDRSFLRLYPGIAVVTAIDPDHLDIYGTYEQLREAFDQFVSQIRKGGILVHKYGLEIKTTKDIEIYTYSLDDSRADFYAEGVQIENGRYSVNVHTPHGNIHSVHIGVPGMVNVENSIVALAIAALVGADHEKIKAGLASFEGVQRRFDYQIRRTDMVYIDDYAHHPEELRFTIESVRELYPGKRITGIFQPHLYSRTRDFADGFAKSLSLLDELILLEIYPAREEPIDGVSSGIIFEKVSINEKIMCTKGEIIDILGKHRPEVLLTLGAGDIDTLVVPIENLFSKDDDN